MTRARAARMPLDAKLPGGARRIFFAVSDPTRRRILDLLLLSECSVSDLVRPFRISQPAISQHLRILREAGLVHVRRRGRERRYRLRGAQLRAVYDWAAHYERFWNAKFHALGAYLEQQAAGETE
jgi:DNA-binding transcriptional ArsR family regulator